jgi:hypothetical protein
MLQVTAGGTQAVYERGRLHRIGAGQTRFDLAGRLRRDLQR